MGKLLADRIEPTHRPSPAPAFPRRPEDAPVRESGSSRSGGAVSPGVTAGRWFSQADAAAPGIDAAPGTDTAPADIKLPRQVGSHKMRYVSNPYLNRRR